MHGTFCTVLKTSEAALIFLPGFLVLPTDKPRFPFCLSTEIDGILYSGQMPLLSAHFVSFGNSSLAHLLWENQFFQPQLVRFLRATHHSSPQTWPWNCTYTRTESLSLLSQDCSEKLTHRADTRTLSCSVGQPIMPTCEPKREVGTWKSGWTPTLSPQGTVIWLGFPVNSWFQLPCTVESKRRWPGGRCPNSHMGGPGWEASSRLPHGQSSLQRTFGQQTRWWPVSLRHNENEYITIFFQAFNYFETGKREESLNNVPE